MPAIPASTGAIQTETDENPAITNATLFIGKSSPPITCSTGGISTTPADENVTYSHYPLRL